MNGKRLLEQSISTIEERQKMYGSPKENFEHIAKRWSLLLGQPLRLLKWADDAGFKDCTIAEEPWPLR
jgi:hypothetical protein